MADPLPNHLSRPRGPCPRTFRAAPLLLAASLAACSAPHESSLETKTLPAVSCGPYGHILPEALPGELYRADDPAIRSVVVSNATVTFGAPWSLSVDELDGSGPLVVQCPV